MQEESKKHLPERFSENDAVVLTDSLRNQEDRLHLMMYALNAKGGMCLKIPTTLKTNKLNGIQIK